MKKQKSKSISLKCAIFLFAIGIFLGSVFTFGMQYWNKNISQEECKVVKTQFLSYDEIRQAKRHMKIKEIAIYCTDGNSYFIDGVSIDEELQNQLSLLSQNDNITLLIHPNSNKIVEFSSDKSVLLSFKDTINKLESEASAFLFLGLFMYFCAFVGLYYATHHIIQRKTKG